MSSNKCARQYECVGDLAPLMHDFISLKITSGLKYTRQAYVLDRFSRFTCRKFGKHYKLNDETLSAWRQSIMGLKSYTQAELLYPIRDFSQYLNEMGHTAKSPVIPILSPSTYIPHVFTEDELTRFFTACDNIVLKCRFSSMIPVSFPLIYRMLAGCGLRVSEALQLRLHDVDTDQSVMRIVNTKNGKERIVPMELTLCDICKAFIAHYCSRSQPDDYLFQTDKGKLFNESTMHERFKKTLAACGIEHKGRGFGPRTHDLRHTHAVNAARNAQLSGTDMNYFLPVLAVYLGHENILGTEKYLHLPYQYYDELRDIVSAHTESVIPEVRL